MRTGGGNNVESINNVQCKRDGKIRKREKARGANFQEIRTLLGIDPRERRRTSRKSGNVRSRKKEADGKTAFNHDSEDS